MMIEISKEDIINMICGAPLPPMAVCNALNGAGLIEPVGNCFDSTWEWNRDALDGFTEEKLWVLYQGLKNEPYDLLTG